MSEFPSRLRDERKRLGLSQEALAALGGVKLNAQSNYENGKRAPDSAYLEAIASHGVDVGYLLTGVRSAAVVALPANKEATPFKYKKTEPHEGGPLIAAEPAPRYLTADQQALLDNYKAADEQGRAAARTVLEALAQPKRANG